MPYFSNRADILPAAMLILSIISSCESSRNMSSAVTFVGKSSPSMVSLSSRGVRSSVGRASLRHFLQ